jgi:hypothetical protein
MDPIYAPAFASQLNDLIEVSQDKAIYSRIAGLVQASDRDTKPQGTLRVDGALFLVLNMGAMIVIPWQRAHDQDFFEVYQADLAADIRDILNEAKLMASQLKATEISANLLVAVTATRRGGQRTRGTNIWGP